MVLMTNYVLRDRYFMSDSRQLGEDKLLLSVCPQHCAHVGPEFGEEAQVCVQTTLLPGEEGHPHMLHLQP